ncbi:hypothetical protein B0H17DRAFT_943392 [Mycena rosella]|uniref:CCHC-type domain-containing protein n=1 Tax=Mycena rosella TaxID=1033263 RepID=A0AAD7GDC1_MYCRO|nr:hypothetical protein B0H17DRAFT_943392 [Mycena rosella]
MCFHYLMYLRVIKGKFLGTRWQLVMNLEFKKQSFCQEGHEKETPQMFLGKRIQLIHMLTNSDDSGPMKVYLIMAWAPLIWRMILVIDNIKSSEELYEKVNDHDTALIEGFKWDTGENFSLQSIASGLRKMGFNQNPASVCCANLTWSAEAAMENTLDSASERFHDSAAVGDGEEKIKQVYQTLAKCQRLPPKGGYPFKKNDHVITKMSRKPPSPCKICGSGNHWDKECPDFCLHGAYQEGCSCNDGFPERGGGNALP